MSKAIITLTANEDGEVEVVMDFFPPVKDEDEFEDHPAAMLALSMVNYMNTNGTIQDTVVFGDDE